MYTQITEQKPLFFLNLPNNVKYALLVLVNLSNQKSISINEMATKYFIPKPDLESIFLNLQKGGLIDSDLNAQQSYVLKRQPTQITLLDVVRAMESEPSPAKGFEVYTPDRKLIHQILQKAQTAAQNRLQQCTLQDLCQKQKAYSSSL